MIAGCSSHITARGAAGPASTYIRIFLLEINSLPPAFIHSLNIRSFSLSFSHHFFSLTLTQSFSLSLTKLYTRHTLFDTIYRIATSGLKGITFFKIHLWPFCIHKLYIFICTCMYMYICTIFICIMCFNIMIT